MSANGSEVFGCERCWPESAEAAWKARGSLTHAGELIDESHFHVMTLACPACQQRFLSIFTETIDWNDGDDSQYWTLIPLTSAEEAELARNPSSLSETKLEALGKDRRCLRRSHPTGAAASLSWGTGIFIGFHD